MEDEMVGWHHRLDGHEFETKGNCGHEFLLLQTEALRGLAALCPSCDSGSNADGERAVFCTWRHRDWSGRSPSPALGDLAALLQVEPPDPSLCPHLLYVVGHLLGQVLQELLSDHVGTDFLRCLAGEDLTVELPGPWPGLCQEVLLWAEREEVSISVPSGTSLSLSLPGGTLEACLHLVHTKSQAN